tara:strand:+ start:5420 stop:5758 length:339 start_codon:yes stop_codon:yes gene_type:complete
MYTTAKEKKEPAAKEVVDMVNSPKHPSGVECIDITEHFCSNIGNVIKHVWQCAFKGKHLQDLLRAEYYLKREIAKVRREQFEEDTDELWDASNDPSMFSPDIDRGDGAERSS